MSDSEIGDFLYKELNNLDSAYVQGQKGSVLFMNSATVHGTTLHVRRSRRCGSRVQTRQPYRMQSKKQHVSDRWG